MRRFIDYYRILQVHHLAEAEVIESAYKRLARKYHPDINRDDSSVELMQRINQAYEVLGDPARRLQYDLVWKDKFDKSHRDEESHKDSCIKNEKSFSAAKAVLEEYFRNLMNKCFDYSYELISSIDKRNITRDDFVNWQNAVSEVFKLTEYSCNVYGVYKTKLVNGHIFVNVVEFSVNVVEYNTVMDMTEKDYFIKMTILEDGKWRIIVGYEEVQPFINKFKALTGLLTAKTVINELVQNHSRMDSLTGLLNQRGILERIENEILRFNRYGNVFSLIMCDIDIIRISNHNTEQDAKEYLTKQIGGMLLSNLRKLDVVGRWGDKAFLILLPETGLASALKVTRKINGVLKSGYIAYKEQAYKAVFSFETVEYESSLEETLDRIFSRKSL